MRFSCERDLLANSIGTASRALETRSYGNGVHLNLKADSLTIFAHETDMLIEVRIEVIGHEDGRCVVPTPLTQDMIRSLPEGIVEVEVDDMSLTMQSGKAKISVYLVADFNPEFTREDGGDPVTVQAGDLREALTQVIRASAQGEARDFVYTGVLFAANEGELRLVATDGIRMAIRDLAGISLISGDGEVLLPARSLSELERILSAKSKEHLKVMIGKREASFEVGDYLLVTRIIDEKYRDYKQVIQPSYPRRLVVKKSDIMDSLRRLRRMARENRELTNLKLEISETSVKLSVNIPQVGNATEEIEATYVGEDGITLAFDPELLNEGIDAVSTEYAAIDIVAANKAVRIANADNSDLIYLLMPIRQ